MVAPGQADPQLSLGQPSWLVDTQLMLLIGGVAGGVVLVVVVLVLLLLARARRLNRTSNKAQWVQDTYEAGFSPAHTDHASVPDGKSVGGEKAETESGIYSWLESLPRSETRIMEKGMVRPEGEEEGEEGASNSSRPTTSTDDEIEEIEQKQQPLYSTPIRRELRPKKPHQQPLQQQRLPSNKQRTNLSPSEAELIDRLNGGTGSIADCSSSGTAPLYIRSHHSQHSYHNNSQLHQQYLTVEPVHSPIKLPVPSVPETQPGSFSASHGSEPTAAVPPFHRGGYARASGRSTGGQSHNQLALRVEPLIAESQTSYIDMKRRRHESIV